MSEETKNKKNSAPTAKRKSVQKTKGKPSGNHGAELVALKKVENTKSLLWSKIETGVVAIGMVALVVLGTFSIATSKQTVFIQTDNTGRTVPLVPLSNPKHSDAFVEDWFNKCMVETFDFYHKNMDEHLNEMKGKCFNEAGYKSLLSGLIDSGNYSAIKEKELFSNLSIPKTPVVVRKKSDESAPYRWLIQSEGILTLSTTKKDFPNMISITAVVERSSLLEDNIGLSIEKIIIKNKVGL